MLKTIGKGALILTAGVLAGSALLWGAYLLPLTEQSTHVAESIRMLDQEGWYPTAPLMYPDQDHTVNWGINPGGVLDNFTDSIMITTAGRNTDDGALYQAMNMAGREMADGYSYYWHGYVALLRPLLLFLNYADIRVLNQLVQMLLVFCLAFMLYRKTEETALWPALVLTVYGLLMPTALSHALQYSWVFYIGMFGSLTVVGFRERLATSRRIYFLFLILGMLTSYMDLLTYPLFTWGLPMIWWIVTEKEPVSGKKHVSAVILCGSAWVCGYGGLWAGKWLIGGLILRQSIWNKAWHEVLFRAGVSPASAGQGVSHWNVLLRHIKYFSSIQGVLLLGAWLLWWGIRAVRSGIRDTGKVPALLLISLSPAVWYTVLHDHSFVHSNFTYRTLTVGLAALLAAMISSFSESGAVRRGKEKWAAMALSAAAAAVCLSGIREESFSHNGGTVPEQMELGENIELIQEFVPTYGQIPAIDLLLYTQAGKNGRIRIKVLEEGQVRWETRVPATEIPDRGFYELPTDLRLKKGRVYQLSLSCENLGGGQIAIGVTGTGAHPLKELASLQIGGQKLDTQIICGFRYRYLARLRILLLAAELQILLYWNIYLVLAGQFRRFRDTKDRQNLQTCP